MPQTCHKFFLLSITLVCIVFCLVLTILLSNCLFDCCVFVFVCVFVVFWFLYLPFYCHIVVFIVVCVCICMCLIVMWLHLYVFLLCPGCSSTPQTSPHYRVIVLDCWVVFCFVGVLTILPLNYILCQIVLSIIMYN